MAILQDITLGRYYPADSVVHRLDPRTKLVASVLLMTGLLLTDALAVTAIWGVLTFAVVLAGRLPLPLVLRNLRAFVWLFVLTMVVHSLFTAGSVWTRLPVVGWTVTREGVRNGLLYSFRLAVLVVMAALLTLTTSPIEITDGLDRLMRPLRRVGVPVHELAMMMSLALRFVPTLLEEADRLQKAQVSRGASFEGHLVQRAQSVLPLIVPLFVSSFRRADELALAMDARCYRGGEGRTCYRLLRLRPIDYVTMAVSAALVAIAAIL
ncbi:MAG: energy-coupling factor transporter transmembrane component T [bacterium]|nr:energy-coupling factor transporter transmembrane protein EcfT [candidate division KSB1 bacterium]MDH7561042.1 energy-coupling factor transporter transmembrane component T [bacterium]